MGFGSLGLVCKLFNRKYIGIEKNKERIEIAKKLISEGKLIKSIPEYLQEVKGNQNETYLFGRQNRIF